MLAKKLFLGAALYSPQEAILVLSERGLAPDGGAVPILFSIGFAVAVALVITVAVAVLLSFFFRGCYPRAALHHAVSLAFDGDGVDTR